MRSARGKGGSGPEGGIEDAWLKAKAQAIATAEATMERAARQAFGFSATDFVPVLEALYRLPNEGNEQERRERITEFEARPARADIPALEASLKELSPLFSIITYPRELSTIAYQGKWLAPRADVPTYGDGPYRSQPWANYATEYVLRCGFDVVANGGLPDPALILRAAALLRERLPAWMTFQITNSDDAGCSSDGGPDGFDVADFTCVEPGS